MATQKQIAQNMIDQLRTLDASISAEVGTPERRIIDTVAQAIADAQIDLNVLQGAFDIESKFGDELDNMLSMLGFGRQDGTRATGYVTFSRDIATTNTIIINSGTTVYASSGGDGNVSVIFRTTTTVAMLPGTTEVIAPIEAIQPGKIGNVAANTITSNVGSPIYGITGITNPYPTQGGLDRETDSELKARFTTAGPFRNLAGTRDQFLAKAFATKSKKANVVGPISKYSEYIQVPAYSDAEEGGNGPTDRLNQFTTALSNNINAKHIYDNLPHFIVNDSDVSPIYFNKDYDYILNIDPADKNKGDAARNSDVIDPTSTDAPTIYQPNVTFTNVYIGDINSRPNNSIAPGDVLLFEYSYMSSASRNDYLKNITNCVDVYVNGEDAKTASTVIPRPGNYVPTFIFVEDESSAFYVNKYRRAGEPGHRPVSGNIFTPLYHQPVIDVPDQVNLSDGTFIKGIHYWLIEEITDLYGTIRARNGIEWSTTIPAKKSSDPDVGPYTGNYINTDVNSLAQLKVALPSSPNNSASTIISNTNTIDNVTAFDITHKQISTTTVGKIFTSVNHYLHSGDTIVVQDVGAPFDGTFVITGTGNASINNVTYYWVSYNIATQAQGNVNANPVAVTSDEKFKLKTISTTSGSSTAPAKIKVDDSTAFPASGYIQIVSEILRYTSNASNIFTIVERGCFNTIKSPINLESANVVSVLIEIKSTTTEGMPSNDYILIDEEQIQYSLPVADVKTLLRVDQRAANGSYVSSHTANTAVYLLLTAVDPSIQINNYQYDENIILLQSSLEENKQITTDVLAHKAKMRYFKPDVTIMYSQGANKNSINKAIKNALVSYFDSIYFGNEIQLSDILQTIHNVGGVDNVRWSKDVLSENDKTYDLEEDARTKLVETNKFGEPISKPVLDLVKIGNGSYATEYQFYLPYLELQTSSFIPAPGTISTALTDDAGFLSNTTYYYVVTAINENGETSFASYDSETVTSNKNVFVTWGAVDGATGYKLYRNTANSWTSGSLLLATLNVDETSYTDSGSATTVGLPPNTNQALIKFNENYSTSNFAIQYGKNQPVLIEYDDFIVQIYDENFDYSKGDIVKYGDKYYKSLVDDNLNKDPSESNSSYWALDTVNKIGFTSKVNANGNVITVSNQNNFVYAPSFDNPITITFINANDKNTLLITDTTINAGYGAHNNDFQIGENELAALPEGNSSGDIDSMITIRVKAQNTWNSIS